ncbi:UNVERIFIED_CONTAM: hypothetical protein Slati_2563300 [Sesamum latifolium]|uniref:SHSP domain-containing protein n=1 Tax=Sesamum latifolium TaxID=2727402 RepID=A0AAW2VTW8_9LAMI
MELELGLKLTSIADEFTSDFKIAKDRAGPLFLSRETDAMFILTAHLKGYKRGNIKIDINEDGTSIAISGERQVKETVMVGWKVYKKDTETKGFKKVFRIPDGVILDKIKAKFNEDESTLTITMPKQVKGIRGTAIEEIEEKQDLVKEGTGNLQVVDEKIHETGTSNQEKDELGQARNGEEDRDDEMPSQTGIMEHPVSGQKDKGQEEDLNEYEVIERTKGSPGLETKIHKEEQETQKTVAEIEETTERQQDQELDHAESLDTQLAKQDQQVNNNQVPDKADDNQEEEKERPSADERPEEAPETQPGRVQEEEHKPRAKRCKMCIPIVAGSTILLSFVVFVFQIMRSKNQTSRRKD